MSTPRGVCVCLPVTVNICLPVYVQVRVFACQSEQAYVPVQQEMARLWQIYERSVYSKRAYKGEEKQD